MVRNLLVSRELLYCIPDWVARHAPELFDLYHCDVPQLHDDRLGASLERLAMATTPEMILTLTRTAIPVFGVSLDELHNDSTTIAFRDAYASAAAPCVESGREEPAITWGHSKDRRPDLKQLLFTLTLARDSGVPMYFQVNSGNVNDGSTHRQTLDLLRQLVGSPDFLYVADCKLASRENLRHGAARGGRFVTILPASRREDAAFRARLRDSPQTVTWTPCWTRGDAEDVICQWAPKGGSSAILVTRLAEVIYAQPIATIFRCGEVDAHVVTQTVCLLCDGTTVSNWGHQVRGRARKETSERRFKGALPRFW